jgi:hypothetical protein
VITSLDDAGAADVDDEFFAFCASLVVSERNDDKETANSLVNSSCSLDFAAVALSRAASSMSMCSLHTKRNDAFYMDCMKQQGLLNRHSAGVEIYLRCAATSTVRL